ncbi:MAG: site-2 protease family protein [Thermotogae bacterium]|nr:site-2 protease family protein [Thermotogota bacterium]
MHQELSNLALFLRSYVYGKFILADFKAYDTGKEGGYILILIGDYTDEDVKVIERNRLFPRTIVYRDRGRLAVHLIAYERREFPWLNVVMFVLTLISTFFAGALNVGADPFGWGILEGWVFALPLLAILGAHEFGHYLVARRYGIPASLPYFIPFPSLIGTMGAVIRLRGILPSRRALLYMAFAGPIAGFIVALPILAVGLSMSQIVSPQLGGIKLVFGEPLIFKLMVKLVLGGVPEGKELLIHPVAFAGWVGIFVTALNLIPLGQLDGGHILYALLPRIHRKVGWAVILAMLPAGLLWNGWWVWAFIGILMGPWHPPPIFNEREITTAEKVVGVISLLLLLLSFTLVPIKVQT